MPNTKPWWQSKTLWFNALFGALGAIEASASLIQPFVQGNVYGWGMLVLIVGNKVLRIISAEALTLK